MEIESNAHDVARWMLKVEKQIPYAASVTLNKTVWELRKLETHEMKRAFRSPTPYALRAVRFKNSNKRNLTAQLYVNDTPTKAGGNTQASFLKRQVVGGGRRGKRIEGSFSKAKGAPDLKNTFGIPGKGVKKNAFGNVTGALQKAMAAGVKNRGTARQNDKYFIAKRGGTTAVWEKYGRKVKGEDGARRKKARPVMIFTRRPRYKKRFRFYEVAHRNASNVFDMTFNRVFNSILLKEGLTQRGVAVRLGAGDQVSPASDFKSFSERFK